MLNVANLKPQFFDAFLAGAKRTERRWRTRLDGRLEQIERGEPIALLEIGSDRCIRAEIIGVLRTDYDDGCLYSIRIREPRLTTAPGVRKIQGWHRREKL